MQRRDSEWSRPGTEWLGSLAATLLAAACLVSAAPAGLADRARQTSERTAEISPLERYLADRARPQELFPLAGEDRRQALWDQLRRFYRQRDHEPAWIEENRPSPAAMAFVEELQGAVDQGLQPAAYRTTSVAGTAPPAGLPTTPVGLLETETTLTAAFLAYAADLCCGRVDPRGLSDEWHLGSEPIDLVPYLEEGVSSNRPAAALDALVPPHDDYLALKRALGRYRAIAREGGWPRVPTGEVLEPGDPAPVDRLRALIARLEVSGDLSERAARRLKRKLEQPGEVRYDAALVATVERFQSRHGLETDGRLGPETMAELDRTIEQRIDQISLNLERWRWLPRDLGERHIRVNVADFRLEAFAHGRKQVEMAVVTGKKSWPTPMFSDRMTRVEINPYWNVPESIATTEVLPRSEEEPGYFREEGYEFVDVETGEVVPPGVADPSVVGESLRVRQVPGPKNALGRIKFLFPNTFNVYLHDTPGEEAFEQRNRALSHGCIRVERPLELADWVFAREPDWNRERVRRTIGEPEPTTVPLEEPIPVYILYWTAFVDAEGRLQFRDDLYGYDELLREHLEAVRHRLEDGLAASPVATASGRD